MAISKEDKKTIIEGLKSIKIESFYASEDEDKRKWFRFGAYDALNMIVAVIGEYPETEEPKKRAKSAKSNPS